MNGKENDFYIRLRGRMRTWIAGKAGRAHKFGEVLMLAPDMFHLLCKLIRDPDVPVSEKTKIAGAIAYFISPIDLVPEAIVGPAGYIDDIAVAAFVLNSVVNRTDPEIVRRHWAGEGDVLVAIQYILNMADQMLGSGLWGKVKRLFQKTA